jgi:hypothetical protein
MESTNEPNARRLFRNLREDLGLRRSEHLAAALTDLPMDLRDDLETELERVIDGATFFQRENPFVRHVVLRKRATLEDRGLLDKIAVNVHPEEGLVKEPHRFNALFQEIALRTTPDFDRAYDEARAFGRVLAKRGKGGGFMKNLMQQRVCSSVVAGINSATTLLEGRQVHGDTDEVEADLDIQTDAERAALESLINALEGMSDDPKLRAIRYYLTDEDWLELGCIIFSQYYNPARWVADALAQELPAETIGLYAGADRSPPFLLYCRNRTDLGLMTLSENTDTFPPPLAAPFLSRVGRRDSHQPRQRLRRSGRLSRRSRSWSRSGRLPPRRRLRRWRCAMRSCRRRSPPSSTR